MDTEYDLFDGTSSLLTLIMPVFDDGEVVIPTIATLALTIKYPFDLFVIYDFEEDKTIPVVLELKKYFPNISLIQNEKERGVVNAINTGIKRSKTPFVGIWICYQVDPFGLINEMISKMLEGNDFVTTSRFVYRGRFNRGGILKRLLSRYGNKILRLITGTPLTDATSSIKIYKNSFLKSNPITTKISGGWALSLELTLKALANGLRYCEIPLEKKNLSLMHGVTRFNVRLQLPEYIRWLVWGLKRRRIIRNNYNKKMIG